MHLADPITNIKNKNSKVKNSVIRLYTNIKNTNYKLKIQKETKNYNKQ